MHVQVEQLEERLRAAESAAAAAAASGSSVASSAAANAAAEEQMVQLRQQLAASRTQVGAGSIINTRLCQAASQRASMAGPVKQLALSASIQGY